MSGSTMYSARCAGDCDRSTTCIFPSFCVTSSCWLLGNWRTAVGAVNPLMSVCRVVPSG